MVIDNKNYEFDSNEEKYYSWWLDELKEAGYIWNYTYQEELIISNDAYITLQKLNKKSKEYEETQFHLLNDLKYTADFRVYWCDTASLNNDKMIDSTDIFFIKPFISKVIKVQNLLKQFHFADKCISAGYNSYVDTKGTFAGANNTTAITFPIKQKMIYDKLDIYVNSIKPLSDKGLFAYTFTPKKYLKTDVTGKDRKINWTVRTLDEYVNGL